MIKIYLRSELPIISKFHLSAIFFFTVSKVTKFCIHCFSLLTVGKTAMVFGALKFSSMWVCLLLSPYFQFIPRIIYFVYEKQL